MHWWWPRAHEALYVVCVCARACACVHVCACVFRERAAVFRAFGRMHTEDHAFTDMVLPHPWRLHMRRVLVCVSMCVL